MSMVARLANALWVSDMKKMTHDAQMMTNVSKALDPNNGAP